MFLFLSSVSQAGSVSKPSLPKTLHCVSAVTGQSLDWNKSRRSVVLRAADGEEIIRFTSMVLGKAHQADTYWVTPILFADEDAEAVFANIQQSAGQTQIQVADDDTYLCP